MLAGQLPPMEGEVGWEWETFFEEVCHCASWEVLGTQIGPKSLTRLCQYPTMHLLSNPDNGKLPDEGSSSAMGEYWAEWVFIRASPAFECILLEFLRSNAWYISFFSRKTVFRKYFPRFSTDYAGYECYLSSRYFFNHFENMTKIPSNCCIGLHCLNIWIYTLHEIIYPFPW